MKSSFCSSSAERWMITMSCEQRLHFHSAGKVPRSTFCTLAHHKVWSIPYISKSYTAVVATITGNTKSRVKRSWRWSLVSSNWNLQAQQILVDQPNILLYQNCYCLLDLSRWKHFINKLKYTYHHYSYCHWS